MDILRGAGEMAEQELRALAALLKDQGSPALFFLFFSFYFLLLSFFFSETRWSGMHSVAQDDFALIIFLHPGCWDYKCVPLYPAITAAFPWAKNSRIPQPSAAAG